MTVTDPKQNPIEEDKSEDSSSKFSLELFFQSINKWLKLIAPLLIVLSFIVAAIAAIITAIGVIIAAFTYIDNTIEKKFKDPLFLNEVALRTRLPFVIFNEKEQILHSSPQNFHDEYVDTITVNKDDKGSIKEIVFSPKKFLNLPPIIECFNANIEFHDAEPFNEIDWIYRAKKMKYHDYGVINEEGRDLSVKKFKITVIP